MRARGLKPAFFKNELLAIADPLYSLIFAGLWCIADRAGRLEDRPVRIHFEINAGRAYEGTESALNWLAEHGFIERYEVDGRPLIQVTNFERHQHPHVNEKASELPPPPSESTVQAPESGPNMSGEDSGAGTVQEPESHDATRSSSLTPSSLTPDCLTKSGPQAAPADPQSNGQDEFEAQLKGLQSIYPRRSGSQRWPDARKAIRARLGEGHTWAEILEGAGRYARWCEATGKTRTETVQQAATFVGRNKGFLEEWEPPSENANGAHKPQSSRERSKQRLRQRAEQLERGNRG